MFSQIYLQKYQTIDIFTKDIKQYLYKTKKLIPKNQLLVFIEALQMKF